MDPREQIIQELRRLPEEDLDEVLRFIHSMQSRDSSDNGDQDALLLAETALARDWLTAAEDEAWRGL